MKKRDIHPVLKNEHETGIIKSPVLKKRARDFFTVKNYSTVTDFARLRGLSMSQPLSFAT